MTRLTRRNFLQTTTAACCSAAAVGFLPEDARADQQKRKFTMDLVCGAIGVRAKPAETILLAQKYGFESLQPSPTYLAELSDGQLSEVLDGLKERKLVWGAAGLPVDFRRDEATFDKGMARLPEAARSLQRAGASRVSTWLRPSHDSLT